LGKKTFISGAFCDLTSLNIEKLFVFLNSTRGLPAKPHLAKRGIDFGFILTLSLWISYTIHGILTFTIIFISQYLAWFLQKEALF
jgi:hypothetical protein